MKKLLSYLLAVFLLLAPILSQAQVVAELLQDYSTYLIDEDIHLQLSESVIGEGEPIWFQATITSTDSSQEPSRVVYLELFNQQRLAVAQGIYPASSGVATGQLTLPDSLRGGWYQLRAYTKLMRNNDPASFPTQMVLVVNSDLPNSPTQVQVNQSVLALYPEGGGWVAGQKNSVIAQIPNVANDSDTATIEIIRVSDSTVVTRTRATSELAEFTFTPHADSSYAARLIISDTNYISLPKAKTGIYALRVIVEGGKMKIAGEGFLPTGKAFVAIRSGDRLLHYQPIVSDTFLVEWPTSSVAGLVEVAVLGNQAQVLAQRMIYMGNQAKPLSLRLSEDKVPPREEVNITVSTDENLSEESLAITVRKVHFSSNLFPEAVLSDFSSSGISLPQSLPTKRPLAWLNRWLITQTPAWPSWKTVLTQREPVQEVAKEDEFLLITGKVQTAQPIDEEDQVLLSIPGDNPYFEYSSIEEDGTFAVPISRVYGLQNSILQYNSATDSPPPNIQWEVDEAFAPPISAPFSPPYLVSDEEWQSLTDSYQSRKRIWQNYYDIEESEEDTIPKPRKQFRFYGAPNIQINPDDYIALPSFEEICRELLPGVRLMKKRGKYDFDVFNPGSRRFLPNEPTLFLDGVPIQDRDYFINFPPEDIKLIETVNRRTYYGNVRLDGVISLYTKQEKAYEEALSGQAHFTTLPYYTSSAAFSAPDSLNSSLPDFRTLLHWQDRITPNSDGSIISSFTASDELGVYEVIVRGVTKAGVRLYGRTTFEVNPADLP